MSKSDFGSIMEGLHDAAAVAEGRADPSTYRIHPPAAVNVAEIRKRLGLTQAEFAARYGFSLGRIRDWEQHRTTPAASDRVLLTVIDREPEAVERALETA